MIDRGKNRDTAPQQQPTIQQWLLIRFKMVVIDHSIKMDELPVTGACSQWFIMLEGIDSSNSNNNNQHGQGWQLTMGSGWYSSNNSAFAEYTMR